MSIFTIHKKGDEFLAYLTKNDYCHDYICNFQRELRSIKKFAEEHPTGTYEEYYLHVKTIGVKTPATLAYRRQMIGRLEQYDLYGVIPGKKAPYIFLKRNEYDSLSDNFKMFINSYIKSMDKNGLATSTIKSRKGVLVKFCSFLMSNGVSSFENISCQIILDYFYDGDLRLRGMDVVKIIRLAIDDWCGKGIPSSRADLIKAYLPSFGKSHPVYPYLQEDEAKKILKVLMDEDDHLLSKRDRAIGILFYFTGMRREDVSTFKLKYIDWEKNTVIYHQGKSQSFNTIPLRPVVGNAIFNYVLNERPLVDSEYLFLTTDRTPRRLKGGSIYDVMDKVFRLAGVRTEGGRKGTHIFRHHLTSHLIKGKTDIRLVSDILGHSSPISINPYLQSDFRSLKECSLSIDKYPLGKEVL
jgi:integrase